MHEQLVFLGAAAHVVLALYSRDKGNFIPVQLYFDFMSMVKNNVYFCVAKTQLDDPEGSFWLILLGTDGLEDLFGKVWTMIGNDTNADQLQLADRIDLMVPFSASRSCRSIQTGPRSLATFALAALPSRGLIYHLSLTTSHLGLGKATYRSRISFF